MSFVLSNKGKGMQSSSEQPLVGEERYVTTRITAAKETRTLPDMAELLEPLERAINEVLISAVTGHTFTLK